MPFETIHQSSFVGGELSPELDGRIDIERYRQGCEQALNVIVRPEGGVSGRPGSAFVAAARAPSKFTRLLPFLVTETLHYVLQFGDGYIRFHVNHGTVVDGRDFANGTFASDITGWTDTSAGTGAIAHDAGNQRMNLVGAGAGNEARAEQSFKAVSINQYTVTVDVFDGAVTYKVGTTSGASDVATGSVAVGVDQSFTFQSATSRELFVTFENANADTRAIDNVRLSSPVYDIDSPWLEADLDDIKFAQTSDALYLAHPDFAPRRLRREAVNQWVLSVLDFVDGPYLDFDPDDRPTTTLNPSVSTGTGTIAASAVEDINEGQGFLSTDSGRILRLKNGGSWGWAVITAVNSTLNVDITVRADFAATTPTDEWRLGAWSETTGWPEAVAFFEERLIFANSELQPDRVWGSKSGAARVEVFSPSDFDGTVNDDNGFTYQIADDQQNNIIWLSAGDVLVAGTVTGEMVIDSGSSRLPITPTQIVAKRRTTRGSAAAVPPVRIDNQVLHMQRAGRRLREFRFDFNIEGYVSQDLSIVARHLTASKVFDIAYQQEPYSVVWASTGDGRLIGLTYERQQKVTGWHGHRIGGSLGTGNAVVESLAVIPTPDVGADELWMVVVRTIDGAQVRYIEYLTQPFEADTTAQEDAFFVDSGLTYNGPAATVFAGLDHLEGETLSVLADGAVHPDVAVTGGQITLVRPAAKVAVGLGYRQRVVPMPAEGGSRDGPAQGKVKRINAARIRFHETLGARYGTRVTDEDGTKEELDRLPFRRGGDPMDSPPGIFSGHKFVTLPGGHGRDARPVVEQDQPLPFTVLAISYGVQTDG